MRRASWIVVVIAAGCYQPQREGRCEVTCARTAEQCPNGLSCSGGFCLAPGDPPCTDGSVLSCQMPTISDDFNNRLVVPCGGWGEPTGAVTREGSQLAMRPTIGSPNSVSCLTISGFAFDRGTFVEVPVALTGITTYTQLEVHDPSGGRLARLAIARDETGSAKLILAQGDPTVTSTAYVPAMMRWLRLRPADATSISGEYSSDGANWTQLGVVMTPAPSIVRVSLDAGTYLDTAGDSGTAVFDNFNVCLTP